MKEIIFNSKTYKISKKIGKGKSGYSFLATHNGTQYVIKKIHHEPCSYYSFGNKMESEIMAYEVLRKHEVNIPFLVDYDLEQEIIVKEYIDGSTIYEMLENHKTLPMNIFVKLYMLQRRLQKNNLNIDWFPTNFVLHKGKIYYVDYEYNVYTEEWNFGNWGVKYYLPSQELYNDMTQKGITPNWVPLMSDEIERQVNRILSFCNDFFNGEIVVKKDYQRNDDDRQKLNALMQEIFMFDFESWYLRRKWSQDYIPFTIFTKNQAIANIGVYKMRLLLNGKKIVCYQIGAVCTRKEYRGLGLTKWLLEKVKNEFPQNAIFFLYAANEAINYYPILGFVELPMFSYSWEAIPNRIFTFKLANEDELWEVTNLILHGTNYSDTTMLNAESIVDFCLPFSRKNLLFDAERKVVAIFDAEKNVVEGIYSEVELPLTDILGSLITKTTNLELHFSPKEKETFTIIQYDEHFFINNKGIPYFLLPFLWRT